MCLPGCGAGLSHGVGGVDAAIPEAGIVPRRTEVLGGGLHALADRVRGHTLGSEQPGEARHEGRRHASSAHPVVASRQDRKSTRLNSSHANISYAVFCLKKKTRTLAKAGA